MKNIMEFLKTSLLGGLLVVLPLVLFYLLLSEILQLVVVLLSYLVVIIVNVLQSLKVHTLTQRTLQTSGDVLISNILDMPKHLLGDQLISNT